MFPVFTVQAWTPGCDIEPKCLYLWEGIKSHDVNKLKSFLISHLCKFEEIGIATLIGSMSHSINWFAYSLSTFISAMLPSLSWRHGTPYVSFYLRLSPLNNLPAEDDVVGMIAKMLVIFNSDTISQGFGQGCHMMSSKIGHALMAEWSTGSDPPKNLLDPSEFLE